MKKLKRVAWATVAGFCCCAGLMLLAGERSSGTTTYCPVAFIGDFAGMYIHGCFAQGADCGLPQLVYIADIRMHQLGDCPVCPDPITEGQHPIPAELPEPALVPQADPRFSGILR